MKNQHHVEPFNEEKCHESIRRNNLKYLDA